MAKKKPGDGTPNVKETCKIIKEIDSLEVLDELLKEEERVSVLKYAEKRRAVLLEAAEGSPEPEAPEPVAPEPEPVEASQPKSPLDPAVKQAARDIGLAVAEIFDAGVFEHQVVIVTVAGRKHRVPRGEEKPALHPGG